MGAETQIWVKVVKRREEWIEVYAVTLDEAYRAAKQLPDVLWVEEASYDSPTEGKSE